MRLDLFLKTSRLITRRTLAQKFCDTGAISVNGVVAKAGKDLRAGDEIEIRQRGGLTRVRVASLPATKNVPKSSAQQLYELIEERPAEDDRELI